MDDIGAVVLGGGDERGARPPPPRRNRSRSYEHPIGQLSASMVVPGCIVSQVAACRASGRSCAAHARVAAIAGVFERYLDVACNEVMYRPGGRGRNGRDGGGAGQAGGEEEARREAAAMAG